MNNSSNYEVLMHIGGVFSEKAQVWLPSIEVIKKHDHQPYWAAALMYLVLDKYVSSVEDKHQKTYIEEVFRNLGGMMDIGHSYLQSAEEVE